MKIIDERSEMGGGSIPLENIPLDTVFSGKIIYASGEVGGYRSIFLRTSSGMIDLKDPSRMWSQYSFRRYFEGKLIDARVFDYQALEASVVIHGEAGK